MKVAFCNRKNWNPPLGGDGIQMLKTKDALEQLYNIQIDIITNPEDINSSYDIVHIFNYASIDESYNFFKEAKKYNLKIASSSIFWDYKYAVTPIWHRLGFIGSKITKFQLKLNYIINNLLAFLFNKPILLSNKFRNSVEKFIELSDVVLPNSTEEANLLLDFVYKKQKPENIYDKIRIVHNAVDIKDYKIAPEEEFFEKYKIPRNYVLQVSRVQYIKNQLNLLKSLEFDKDVPIVFVGKIIEPHYYKALKRIAKRRGNVYFIQEIPHSDVYSFYYYAKVHVLLSFRESPGLVSLEALSQCCPVVVADNRFVPYNTYFSNCGCSVDPLNLNDIRHSVLNADKKLSLNFNKEIFTWEYAAMQTYNAYVEISK